MSTRDAGSIADAPGHEEYTPEQLAAMSPAELDALGAALPEDSAPPSPTKLWHDAQLGRNSSPPSARSPSRRSPEGTVGPPPLAWT